ncbi:MAG: MBL fold metallo-hydrolase [Chlamydiales bacterium]|nr:MBL fold metallo-hydrolase [Chlamydiales bacterium]
MILKVFASGPVDTNAYLVACSKTKRGVVIDVPFDCASLILEAVSSLQIHVDKILLTHSHWDHFAGAFDLQAELAVPIFIHAEDAGNLRDPGSDKLPLLFPVKKVDPEGFLEDGQIIPVGELQLEVIHTPGHTPGGVCFYLEKEKVLFSGDTLFQGAIGNLSFPTARPALMWKSLKRLASLPKQTRVYPGHGDPTSIGQEEWIIHAHNS